MSKINVITALFIIIALSSCTKEIYVEIPDNEPKIVVNAYLAPENDTVQVWVSKSTPLYHVYDENNQMLTNATVEISGNGSSWINLNYDANTRSYITLSSVLPIVSNSKYYIRVSAPTFKSVESELTIPAFENINFRYSKYETRVSEWGDTSRLITYKFNDPAGTQNFYAFKAIANHYDGGNTSFTSELYIENSSWLISDKTYDGKEITVTFNGYGISSGDTIQITALQTDETFYLFHSSLENYGGDNPFSEATPIYSNITNGLGVFAGYSMQKINFVIP